MEEALQAAELKAQGLEKVKARMNQDLEDFMLDLEKVSFSNSYFLINSIRMRSLVKYFHSSLYMAVYNR